MSDDGDAPARVARRARLIGFAVLGAFGLYALYRGDQSRPVARTLAGRRAVSVHHRARHDGVQRSPGSAIVLRTARATAHAAARRETRRNLRMGFYVAVLLFYALTLRASASSSRRSSRSPRSCASPSAIRGSRRSPIAIGAAAACHVLFGRWLGAILPTGTLWERLTG